MRESRGACFVLRLRARAATSHDTAARLSHKPRTQMTHDDIKHIDEGVAAPASLSKTALNINTEMQL